MISIRKAYHPQLVVLVVEDYVVFAKEIKHALPQHNVIFARSLQDAKLRYEEYLPDVTFLDIDLPDGNGLELLDYIRMREPNAYVAILTGSKMKEDIASAEAKGASGYIIKPFTKAKIDETIGNYLDQREKDIKLRLKETRQNRAQAVASGEERRPDEE
jgi:CheY-like chemotaxis protein